MRRQVRCYLAADAILLGKTENLFAHSSHAEQSTQAGHNRLRGLAISKASATFMLESKLRSNRKKRFLDDVKRSRAKLEDWVEKHRDDEGFLGLFNEKQISVKRRREIILKAISGRRDNVRVGKAQLCNFL